MTIATIQTECGFEEAWIGKCKQIGNPRCPKHTGRKCVSCGAEATHDCEETGQFVCGENLCDDCEHTIFPSGTNGGIGFNAESLPEGVKRHCKKTQQKFKPWYAREDDIERHDAPVAPERGEWWLEHIATNARGTKTLFLGNTPVAIVGTETLNDNQRALNMTAALNQHSTLVTQRERLLEVLQLIQGFNWQLDDSPHGQEIRRRAEEAITTSEQEGR